MKKKKKLWPYLMLFALIPNFVSAASMCNYNEQTEINTISDNVKVTYEAIEMLDGKTLDLAHPNADGSLNEIDSYKKGFKISVLNISDEITIKIKNSLNESEMNFTNQDANNGTIEFKTDEVNNLVTYTIEIYANKYACAGELFRKISLTTPMYNSYSELQLCDDNPDFYYCQEYITTSNISYTKFKENFQKYQEEKEEKKKEEENKSFWKKLKDFYIKNKVILNIIGSVIVILGVTATVILIKKRRSRVL